MSGAKPLKIHTKVNDNDLKHNDLSFINLGSFQSVTHSEKSTDSLNKTWKPLPTICACIKCKS